MKLLVRLPLAAAFVLLAVLTVGSIRAAVEVAAEAEAFAQTAPEVATPSLDPIAFSAVVLALLAILAALVWWMHRRKATVLRYLGLEPDRPDGT